MRSSRRSEARDLDTLLTRIGRVNPTGAGLGRREQARRYAEKARLQDELVERFGELVHVASHRDMPGVVSLSVPSVGRSAGHAVLESLSASTRDWIERRSDAGGADAAKLRPADDDREPEHVLDGIAQARRFVAAFDFDCAEELLASISREGSGEDRVRAAELLIEIFVDHLARDSDALVIARGLGSGISARTSEHAAVAASRAGDPAAALDFLRRCSTPTAFDLLCGVLASAVTARDWTNVSESWRMLQSFVLAGGGSGAARERARREIVAGIHRYLDESALADVAKRTGLRRLSRELGVEHGTLRELERLERESRIAEARAVARARLDVLVETEPESREVHHLLQVLGGSAAGGDEDPELPLLRQRIATVRREARARAILERLRISLDFEVCLAFFNQPDDVRDEIVARDEAGHARTLERMHGAFGATRRHAAARAATAWFQARSLPVEERWSLLDGHVPMLAQLPELHLELESARPAVKPRSEPAASTWSLKANASSFEIGVLDPTSIDVSSRTWLSSSRALVIAELDYLILFGPDGEGGLLLAQPIGKGCARALRIRAPGVDVVYLGATDRAVHLLERGGRRLDLVFTDNGVEVQREVSTLTEAISIEAVHDCGRTHVLIEVAGEPAARILSLDDSEAPAFVGPGAQVVRGGRRGLLGIVEETRAHILTCAGRSVGEARLPAGLDVHALIFPPDGRDAAPILLASVADEGGPPMLWWSSGEDSWSALGLHEEAADLRAVSFTTLRDRGLAIVLAGNASTRALVSFATYGAELVACEPTPIAGIIGVVVHPSRDVGWIVSCDRGIQATPIGFRPRISDRP